MNNPLPPFFSPLALSCSLSSSRCGPHDTHKGFISSSFSPPVLLASYPLPLPSHSAAPRRSFSHPILSLLPSSRSFLFCAPSSPPALSLVFFPPLPALALSLVPLVPPIFLSKVQFFRTECLVIHTHTHTHTGRRSGCWGRREEEGRTHGRASITSPMSSTRKPVPPTHTSCSFHPLTVHLRCSTGGQPPCRSTGRPPTVAGGGGVVIKITPPQLHCHAKESTAIPLQRERVHCNSGISSLQAISPRCS